MQQQQHLLPCQHHSDIQHPQLAAGAPAVAAEHAAARESAADGHTAAAVAVVHMIVVAQKAAAADAAMGEAAAPALVQAGYAADAIVQVTVVAEIWQPHAMPVVAPRSLELFQSCCTVLETWLVAAELKPL